MGLASKDPGMLSVNVTFSPTFAGASTSGTSGCKKWKFSAQVRQEFVESQWAQLREASAQGRGAHLAVFSDVMGCETEGLHVFSQMSFILTKRISYRIPWKNKDRESEPIFFSVKSKP